MLLLPPTYPLNLTPAFFIEGFLYPADLIWMYNLASGRNILEIGSFRGKSTYAWLVGGATRVLSLDRCLKHWDPAVAEEMLRTNLKEFDSRWELIVQAKDVPIESHSATLNNFEANVVYIDCQIAAEEALTNIRFVKTVLGKGSIICGNNVEEISKCWAAGALDFEGGFQPVGETLWHTRR